MIIDKLMNYDEAVNYVDKNGWDCFIKLLQEKYSDYELYTVSTSWYNDKQYICKAKGTCGDIIIDWK